MSDALPEQVRRALERVVDPCSIATGVPITLGDMGLVQDVAVSEGRARIRLRVTSPFCMHIGNIQERVRDVVGEVPGVDDVQLDVDDGMTWLPSMMAPEAQRRLRAVRPLPTAEGSTR